MWVSPRHAVNPSHTGISSEVHSVCLTAAFLFLGQDFSSGSAVGSCDAPEASVAPGRSVRCCGRASGRDLVGTLSLRAHLCQPECCPGKLCCCWASADGGQACAKAMVRFRWQKSFLLRSHRLCSAKFNTAVEYSVLSSSLGGPQQWNCDCFSPDSL